MRDKPQLFTTRCLLRLPEASDVDALRGFVASNQEHFAPWDPELPVDYNASESWQKRILQAHDEFARDVSCRFVVFERQSQNLLATINATNFERGPFQNCRFGYKIAQCYEGQGFMKEAVGAALRYCFEELGFHRAEANCLTYNERSRGLLRALGFSENGVSKNYLKIAGQWQDHVLCSLLAEDFKMMI